MRFTHVLVLGVLAVATFAVAAPGATNGATTTAPATGVASSVAVASSAMIVTTPAPGTGASSTLALAPQQAPASMVTHATPAGAAPLAGIATIHG